MSPFTSARLLPANIEDFRTVKTRAGPLAWPLQQPRLQRINAHVAARLVGLRRHRGSHRVREFDACERGESVQEAHGSAAIGQSNRRVGAATEH